jgi:predicted PurR-regulated permease PerM
MPKKVEISHRTIIFTVFFLLGLWFLYEVRQIILALFVSLILMSALNPAVNRLEGWRFPRWLAILVIYFGVLGILILGLVGAIPALVEQTGSFAERIPLLFRQVTFLGLDPSILASQITQLGTIPANIFRLTMSLFSNIVSLFALFVITFYLLLERRNLDHYLQILFGEGGEEKAEQFVDKIENRLGSWVRGEITLMVIIGIMTYLGLRFLGIEFALPLAILAGFLEIVPNIGPTISAVPAVLAGLAISPMMALAVTALYFLVQQAENTLIVPKVMQKAAGVNPLITILSLAVGFKLAGPVGAVLAVPVVILIEVVGSEWYNRLRL